jgi:hypothetical protein
MCTDWGVAAVGAIAAITGGILSGAYSYLLARYNRPRLVIDYLDSAANRIKPFKNVTLAGPVETLRM